uniref:BED-type domain-containing protein n=1 Tax=Ascaris lumbricoides TaxID=6252 RepID=A0A9J2Q9R7_ASCLU
MIPAYGFTMNVASSLAAISGTQPPIVLSNARNAGRKKTNPVWDFFTDLKSRGLPGVRCRYCDWITNDRSPTTLKFHLKRKHDTGPGGIWAIVEERIILHSMHNLKSRSTNNMNGESGIADLNQVDIMSSNSAAANTSNSTFPGNDE